MKSTNALTCTVQSPGRRLEVRESILFKENAKLDVKQFLLCVVYCVLLVCINKK